MKTKTSIYLILLNISDFNEKIIVGISFVKNNEIETYFDPIRMEFLEKIINKKKYSELIYLYNFLTNESIKSTDIQNMINNSGIIEIQNRNSPLIPNMEEAKKIFFNK